MNKYLKDAGELFQRAKKEMNSAKKTNDEYMARDASGKARIAATDALKGFLILQGIDDKKLPSSERQRHDMLAQFGDRKMVDLYLSLRGLIHQDSYYEGIINYPISFIAFDNLKKFIHLCSQK